MLTRHTSSLGYNILMLMWKNIIFYEDILLGLGRCTKGQQIHHKYMWTVDFLELSNFRKLVVSLNICQAHVNWAWKYLKGPIFSKPLNIWRRKNIKTGLFLVIKKSKSWQSWGSTPQELIPYYDVHFEKWKWQNWCIQGEVCKY